MNLSEYQYPFLYFRGEAITLKRSQSISIHYFGGPSEYKFTGQPHGPLPLHHICTLNLAQLKIDSGKLGWEIPLFYGMNYDGCVLNYTSHHREINVSQISPNKSALDWPYSGYPNPLPYIPLEINSRFPISSEDFSDHVMQGLEDESDDFLNIIFPPMPDIGVSLWGPSGDLSEVQIIFKCDTQTGEIEAYNACT